MKKIVSLIVLATFFKGYTQCPTPSNLIITIPNATSAQLSWIENGNATAWEVAVMPDFYVGAVLPSNGEIATGNSYIVTGLPPAYGCYVFFVRSVCSATNVSSWVAVGSLGCSTNVFTYLANLSSDSFVVDDSRLIIFPNPSSTIFKITSDTKVDKITIFDTLGKEVLTQTQNTSEVNIEKLTKGIYFIEIATENGKIYRKFIKE